MKEKTIEPKHLELNEALLSLLSPETDEPFTRLEAFHNLLLRAVDYRASVNRFGRDFNLIPGQFVVTYTELGKDWKWSRPVVKKFIDTLCSLGQLEVSPFAKCALIDVVSLRFKWMTDSHPFIAINAYKDYWNGLNHKCESEESDNTRKMPFSKCVTYPDSPYEGINGEDIYNVSQRQCVALLVEEMVAQFLSRKLSMLYTPQLEKSMLDTFYVACAQDKNCFFDAISTLFQNRDSALAREANDVADDAYHRLSVVLSKVSKALLNYANADSVLKASQESFIMPSDESSECL